MTEQIPVETISTNRDVLGEACIWSPRHDRLFWVDIRRNMLQSHCPSNGAHQTWDLAESVGSLAVASTGGVIFGTRSGVVHFDLQTGSATTLYDLHADQPHHRCNDGKCDRQGRFWTGTLNDSTQAPEGGVFCVTRNGLRKILSDIRIPNSIAWSPDGSTMYFTDSPDRLIYSFAFDIETAELSNRRVFARIAPPAVPDGSTVDAEGYLWNAEYDGWRLVRYAPDGAIDRVVDLPVQRPTSCAFGGDYLETLFITSASQDLNRNELALQPLAGRLLAIRPGIRGLAEAEFDI
jgi:sugar lactone lactonase YvrE